MTACQFMLGKHSDTSSVYRTDLSLGPGLYLFQRHCQSVRRFSLSGMLFPHP